jgi:galactokinase
MSFAGEIIKNIKDNSLNDILIKLYGVDSLELQKLRYLMAIEEFESLFGVGRNISMFSAPGRTEVGGNHTDHNNGRILAASINLDIIAVVSPNDDGVIRIKSKGYNIVTVDSSHTTPVENENEHSPSLIRGICAKFSEDGYSKGGFDAYTTSDVLKGSGLSSSAAFEILVGTILNHLYNNGELSPLYISQASQYAENVFFGKPSGLMDQLACSIGGMISVDLHRPKEPLVRKILVDFESFNHTLCVVDTGGSHSDLTDEYSSIPIEMKSVANILNKDVLGEVDINEFYSNLSMIREHTSDRSLLRAIHFIHENERVLKQIKAIDSGEFDDFLRLVSESGRSSFMYNQNVFSATNPQSQGLSLALALSEKLLQGRGAFRVHGGGFAGTIQAYVPNNLLCKYVKEMESIFGSGSCYQLKIRPVGGIKLI